MEDFPSSSGTSPPPTQKCFICSNPPAPTEFNAFIKPPESILQILSQTLQVKFTGNPLIPEPDGAGENSDSSPNSNCQYPFCTRCLKILNELAESHEKLANVEDGIYKRINWIQNSVVQSLDEIEKAEVLKHGFGPDPEDDGHEMNLLDDDNDSVSTSSEVNRLNFRKQVYSKFKVRQVLETKIKQLVPNMLMNRTKPSVSQFNLNDQIKQSNGKASNFESDEAHGNENHYSNTQIKMRQDLIIKMEIEPDCYPLDSEDQEQDKDDDFGELEDEGRETVSDHESDSDFKPSRSSTSGKSKRSGSNSQTRKMSKVVETEEVVTDENGKIFYINVEIIKKPGETPDSEYSVSCGNCGKTYDQARCKPWKKSALAMIKRHICGVHYGNWGFQKPSEEEKKERLREQEMNRKNKLKESREKYNQKRRELSASNINREKELQRRRERYASRTAEMRQKHLESRRNRYAVQRASANLENHSSPLTISPQGEISYKNIRIYIIDLDKRNFDLKCGACDKVVNKQLMKENKQSPYKEIISHIQQDHHNHKPEISRPYEPKPKSMQDREYATKTTSITHQEFELPGLAPPESAEFPKSLELETEYPESSPESEPFEEHFESEAEYTGIEDSKTGSKGRSYELRTEHVFITNELGQMFFGPIQIHQINLENEKFHLKCGECDKTMARNILIKKQMCIYREMVYHILGQHLDGFKCNACERKYRDVKSWKRHTKKNHTEDEIQKKLLANNFPAGGTGLFQCLSCSQRFGSRLKLLAHDKIHRGIVKRLRIRNRRKDNQTTFVCDQCGEVYSCAYFLDRHKKKVHTLKPHKKNVRRSRCSVCKKRFTHQADLIEHAKTHVNEETQEYNCTDCGRKYKSKQGLEQHGRLCKFKPKAKGHSKETQSSTTETEGNFATEK